LIGDVQSAKDAWASQEAAMVSEGYKFIYKRIYEPTETDFTADIVRMKTAGGQMLILSSADVKTMARGLNTANTQGWKPQLMILGAAGYDPTLVPLAGAAAAEGSWLFFPTAMYLGEDSSVIPEVALFQQWLKRTHPDAGADLFTAYGWASARLFVQGL